MPRTLDSTLSASLTDGLIRPVILCLLTFRSGTEYVWSGVGPLVHDAQTYKGMGSLGSLGSINEGVEVKADGTSVTLSGIDSALLNDSLTDIKAGAPAKIWYGHVGPSLALLGAPYLIFSGVVDKPTISPGVETCSITLSLEASMIDLGRATERRYTAADQQLYYPTDSGFNRVEALNDISVVWGS